MDIIDFKLEHNWCLWYHPLNSNDWSIDSYEKIMNIKNYYDICFMLNKFENVNCGMFFLMKKDIMPIFEDEKNINGGYWSLRINKKDTSETWKKIIYYMLIEGILDNQENENSINGISIGPKINNCIFKIWNSDYKSFNNNSLRDDIDIFINNDLYYLEHKESKKKSEKLEKN